MRMTTAAAATNSGVNVDSSVLHDLQHPARLDRELKMWLLTEGGRACPLARCTGGNPLAKTLSLCEDYRGRGLKPGGKVQNFRPITKDINTRLSSGGEPAN